MPVAGKWTEPAPLCMVLRASLCTALQAPLNRHSCSAAPALLGATLSTPIAPGSGIGCKPLPAAAEAARAERHQSPGLRSRSSVALAMLRRVFWLGNDPLPRTFQGLIFSFSEGCLLHSFLLPQSLPECPVTICDLRAAGLPEGRNSFLSSHGENHHVFSLV